MHDLAGGGRRGKRREALLSCRGLQPQISRLPPPAPPTPVRPGAGLRSWTLASARTAAPAFPAGTSEGCPSEALWEKPTGCQDAQMHGGTPTPQLTCAEGWAVSTRGRMCTPGSCSLHTPHSHCHPIHITVRRCLGVDVVGRVTGGACRVPYTRLRKLSCVYGRMGGRLPDPSCESFCCVIRQGPKGPQFASVELGAGPSFPAPGGILPHFPPVSSALSLSAGVLLQLPLLQRRPSPAPSAGLSSASTLSLTPPPSFLLIPATLQTWAWGGG